MRTLPLQAPGELQDALRTTSKTIRTTATPVIFRQGEAARGVFLVEKGTVKLSIRSEQDDTIFERVLGAGSLLGLPATINNVPYTATATVVEDAELTFVSRDELLEMMRQPALAMKILQLLSQEINDMRGVIVGGRPGAHRSAGASRKR